LLLYLFLSGQHDSPIGEILLTPGCKVEVVNANDESDCNSETESAEVDDAHFALTSSGTTYFFTAPSVKEMEKWVFHLTALSSQPVASLSEAEQLIADLNLPATENPDTAKILESEVLTFSKVTKNERKNTQENNSKN